MRIRKDDTVLVIAGKDKGKKGKVLRVDAKNERVYVEGCNIQTRHAKTQQNQPAEIRKIEGPIHVSNVMYWDNKAKAATRIGYTYENGHKKRVSKKTGQVID